MLYTIAVLAHNKLDLTKACIDAVFRSIDRKDAKVLLIDNASTDGTKEWAMREPFLNYHSSPNIGIAAYNLALQHAKSSYLVTLNNDVLVTGDWLERMRQPFLDDHLMAQVGCRDSLCYLNEAGVGDGTIEDGQADYVEGAVMMMRTDLAKEFGLFDPEFRFGYCEDSDLSLRLRRAGYHIATVPRNGVKHQASTSMSSSPLDIAGYHAFNHVVLRRKWGKYLKTRSFEERIAMLRIVAMGDVLLATPVVRQLMKENPHRKIDFYTHYPEVFAGNPDIRATYPTNLFPFNGSPDYDRVINLDHCYERTPKRHIVDSYAEAAGVTVTDYFPHIYAAPNVRVFNGEYYAVIHSGPHFEGGVRVPGRTVTNEIMGSVRNRCCELGLKVFEITEERMPLAQLAAIIAGAKVFVGADSGPAHIAQAMMVPSVILFGAVNPAYRMVNVPFFHPITAHSEEVGCLGCHHFHEAPLTRSICVHPDVSRCMSRIRAIDVCLAIDHVLKVKKMYLETSKIRDHVMHYFREGKGIDIGCQRDPLTRDCVAFDKNQWPEVTHAGDARKLPFTDGSFDWAWSSHCLEDLADTEGALREWLRVLRPGGTLGLYVPHPQLYRGTNLDHVHDGFTPEGLTAFLQPLGCEILETMIHDDPRQEHPCHSSLVIARKR